MTSPTRYFHSTLLLAALLLVGCSDGTDRAPVVAPPSLITVQHKAVPEGAPGEMPSLVFRAVLDAPQPQSISISYQTADGTAQAGDDYLQVAGEVVVPAGAVEVAIVVELFGDSQEEAAETFTLALATNDNAGFVFEQVTGTIANDDSSCDMPFDAANNRWLVNGADPLNYAHRGGVIDFPENTLYAYSEVALAGADVLEMDVYQTADNQLVILHDLDVERTTNGSGQVVDLTLAELRALDAAYWFVPGEGTPHDRPEVDYPFRGIATGDKPPPRGYTAEDFQIPTLEEALQRFPRELINVELKPDLDGQGDYESQIAALLQRYGRYDDLIAASFVDEAANNFKAVAPCVHTSVPLGQGTGLVLASQGDGVIPPVPEHVAFQAPFDTSQINASQLPPGLYLDVVTEDFVTDAHAVNLAVQVWTINSCSEMLRMIGLQVDAIMTDRPLLLEELLNTAPADRRCD